MPLPVLYNPETQNLSLDEMLEVEIYTWANSIEKSAIAKCGGSWRGVSHSLLSTFADELINARYELALKEIENEKLKRCLSGHVKRMEAILAERRPEAGAGGTLSGTKTSEKEDDIYAEGPTKDSVKKKGNRHDSPIHTRIKNVYPEQKSIPAKGEKTSAA